MLLSMFYFNFHMTFSMFLLGRTKVAYMKIGLYNILFFYYDKEYETFDPGLRQNSIRNREEWDGIKPLSMIRVTF